MVAAEASLEAKLRQKAKRQGFALKKSRAAQSLDNQGGYMVVDGNNNIFAGEKFNLTAEDVKKLLN